MSEPAQPHPVSLATDASRRAGSLRKPAKMQRRSKRVTLQVPVLIYGRAADHTPYRDVSRTISVNQYGALLDLRVGITRGQTILVVNSATQEEHEAIARYVGPKQYGRVKVGIEFTRPAPNFWRLYFPPLDPNAPAETS